MHLDMFLMIRQKDFNADSNQDQSCTDVPKCKKMYVVHFVFKFWREKNYIMRNYGQANMAFSIMKNHTSITQCLQGCNDAFCEKFPFKIDT